MIEASDRQGISLKILAVLADKSELVRLHSVLAPGPQGGDIVEGFTDLAEAARALDGSLRPDLAFVDVMAGDHAGLALVHHLSVMAPECEVYALVPANALASGSQALSLGARGLFSLPLTGDELLTAASSVRTRRAESQQLARANEEAAIHRRAAEACARIASVVGSAQIPGSAATAQAVAEVLRDALDAREAAIFVDPRASVSGHISSHPAASGVSSGASIPPPPGALGAFGQINPPLADGRSVLPPAPPPTWRRVALVVSRERDEVGEIGEIGESGTSGEGGKGDTSVESDRAGAPSTQRGADVEPWTESIDGLSMGERIAATRGLWAIPLEAATVRGVLLVGGGALPLDARLSTMLHAVAAQVVTALRLAGERERTSREITVKDPATSAYTFGYFVDVAGREIDRARRFGRRFTLVSVLTGTAPGGGQRQPIRAQIDVVEALLSVVSDLDVVAYLDESEGELGVLLPETDGVGAHRLLRAVLRMVRTRGPLAGIMVGVATFPHDGTGLSQLLRCARRRAESTRSSVVRRLGLGTLALPEILDALLWDPPVSLGTPSVFDQPRAIELPSTDVALMTQTLVSHAIRGGKPLVTLIRRGGTGLDGALMPLSRDEVAIVEASPTMTGDDDVDAAVIVAEHAVYTLLGRDERGLFRGIHAGDPVLADLIAERLGT